MKPLVMFRNVTCVVQCCLNLDDNTDGADGPVQQTPVERKRKTATRVFDIFTWRFLRNEKKTGKECNASTATCGIEHAETALPYLH